MYKRKFTRVLLGTFILCAVSININAQFSLTGQLRTRTEVRHGVGNLAVVGTKSAAFTSQRTRLNFGYKWDRLTIGVAVQDVRVWGQDASTTTNNDGAKLMVHEAWADLVLANKADTTIKFKWFDQMSIKIGRQELIYDDSRLIGNLDWLQQARRHDMALLKTMHQGWQVDLGYAFNQNNDNFGNAGTSYVPGNLPAYVKNSLGVLVPVPVGMIPLAAGGNANNNSSSSGTPVFANPPSTNASTQDYKSFTSLYISKKFNQTKIAGLLFADNFGKYKKDSVGSATAGYVYGRRFVSAGATDPFDYTGSIHRYTYGLMINHTIGNASGFGKIALQAAYYQQSGVNRDNLTLNAYHWMAQATYQKGNFSITPGYEMLSGNDATTPATEDHRFDPLYGTPHKFRGNMDYFYAGTGSPNAGLQDAYFKIKYATNVLSLSADFHNFFTDKQISKTSTSKELGREIDLQLGYTMNKFTNIELGYSIMKASNSLSIAKAQAATSTYNKEGNWFYAMLKFTPDFLYTKPVAIKQ